MQHILGKRVWRTIKTKFPRYLSLILIITLSLYLVISIIAAAETIIQGGEQYEQTSKVENGEFTTFVPLTSKQIQSLESRGITLEKNFSLDFRKSDNSILRVFKNRQKINKITIVKGYLANNKNTLVIDRRYAEEHHLTVGDRITLANQNYKISGIGVAPDYEAALKNVTDPSVDSQNFGVAWLSDSGYKLLQGSSQAEQSEEYTYAYRLPKKMTDRQLKKVLKTYYIAPNAIKDKYFQDYWNSQTADISELQTSFATLKRLSPSISDQLDQLNRKMSSHLPQHNLNNLKTFTMAKDNPRIGGAGEDRLVYKYAGLMSGVIILGLFTYILSIFVTNEIEQDASVIGTLYALGVKKKDLLLHYLYLPVLVTLVAGIVGMAAGLSSSAISRQMTTSFTYYSLPNLSLVRPVYLIVYACLVPPLIAAVVNCIAIYRHLNRPVLNLIKRDTRPSKVSHIKLKNMGFIRTFQFRQLIREFKSAIAVIFGMFIASLLLMLGLHIYAMCHHISVDNKADVHFNYLYTYKYPDTSVPNVGTEAYSKTFKMTNLGKQMDVTMMGITKNNPYFSAKLPNNQSDVSISSAMAQKFNLKVGQNFIVKDMDSSGRQYTFTVTKIVPYSPSFYIFMDIKQMRELFGTDKDYFNVVISKKKMKIPSGRLYSITTKKDIDRASDIYLNIMWPLIYLMVGISSLVFIAVMYLMLKMMLDRSVQNISLVQIFGYKSGEIRKLYLDGNFLVIAIGAAIMIPISKWLMNLLYPYTVADAASAMDMTYSWYTYALIYLTILFFYYLVSVILMRRIKRIKPADILKNID